MNLIQNEKLRWKHFTGNDAFDYPIDYSAALLSANQDGHVDQLYRWAPNSYCHFHRHAARTTSTVLEGKRHVIDVDPESGEELNTRIRKAGDYASKVISRRRLTCSWSGLPTRHLVCMSLHSPQTNRRLNGSHSTLCYVAVAN